MIRITRHHHRLAPALACAVVALACAGCPPAGAAACGDDSDCAAGERCLVDADGATCQPPRPVAPVEDDPAPTGEGEGEGDGVPAPGPLRLSRGVVDGGGGAMSGGDFTLVGAFTTASSSGAQQFRTTPRTVR